MKVAADSRPPARTGGLMEVVEMGISQDAEDQSMVLNVLSNSLYTDKVGAVLREYGCNAFDANVEAGRGEIPIEVRLPNRLDMSCAIRDFGFGMTEEQVKHTFCKLGRSTKRASNAFTGMLGIGSKAGFAYGDSFLVTSYTNGNKAVYNCYRDQGRLLMAKMHEEHTESPDGVEVKVPVRLEDLAEFMTKAERVYRHFKILPKITGAKIDFEIGKPEFVGPRWRYIGNERNSVAVMGNVGYTIEPSSMGTGISEKARTLLELGVEVDFDIGELEIAANREGLQYKDLTRKAIIDRCNEMTAEIGKIFTTRISAAINKWEAHRLYADNFEKMGSYQRRSLAPVIDGKIMWQGKPITTGRFNVDNPPVVGSGGGGLLKYQGVSVVEVVKNNYGRRRTRYNPSPEWIYASNKTQLCVNDLPSKRMSPSRAKGFFDTADITMERLVVFTFQDAKIGAKFWADKELIGAPTINMSSITPATTVGTGGVAGPSAHRSKHAAKAFLLDAKHGAGDICSLYWSQTDVDLEDDGGVYAAIDKFRVLEPSWRILKDGQVDTLGIAEEHPLVFKGKIAELQKAGLAPDTVYGFKKPLLPKLGKKWVRLEDFIAAKMKKLAANSSQELADFLYAKSHTPFVPIKYVTEFPIASTMALYLSTIATAVTPPSGKAMMGLLQLGTAAPWLKKPVPLPKPTIDLYKLEKDVIKTYPLLDIIQRYERVAADAGLAKAMAEYVTLTGK